MLWQQVPQVPGRGLGCPCAWWMQTSPRLVLLGVTARSQPSALASPKCFTEGRDVPDLASLSQRHILVTHGVVFSALSHLPLCPHSVPKGRATLSQVVLSSVPNLCSQRPLPEHSQQRDMSPCPPPPKMRLLCQDCSEKFGAGDACSGDVTNPRNCYRGHGDLCSRTSWLWASNSPPRSPHSPQASCGALVGKSQSG